VGLGEIVGSLYAQRDRAEVRAVSTIILWNANEKDAKSRHPKAGETQPSPDINVELDIVVF
jgi:hypothetical protein